MIQLLIQQYPEAAGAKKDEKETPLHLACLNGQSDSVFQLLITTYPQAAKERSILMITPCIMHVIIKLLIDEYPRAVRIKNDNRAYPLHY